MSVDQEMEELLTLREVVQRLRVANEQLTQGRGTSLDAGTTVNTSANSGGNSASPKVLAPQV